MQEMVIFHSSILRGDLTQDEWQEKKHEILTNLYAYVSEVGEFYLLQNMVLV